MSAHILDKICADKRLHIDQCKQQRPLAELEKELSRVPAVRGFIAALKNSVTHRGYGLIAEIKKASPSKGLIRADFMPAQLAKAYAQGGAACLSVLTDVPYFQGHDAYLRAARQAVTLPVLRKDFILDPYQIYESRILGSDCILLIMAILDDGQASELENLTHHLGMDVLVEVHNDDEMERALKLTSPLIGINNRNLKTLEIDLATTEGLASRVEAHHLLVSESGLHTSDDLARVSRAGAHCFLVGESLMAQDDVCVATQNLLGHDNTPL